MRKDLILMDCTLRDGANVVGKGFSAELTKMMIEGLIRSNIKVIEMGNALGLGAYEARGSIAPLTDVEYLELVQPYLDQAEIGMFMGVQCATEENIALAAKYGLKFLRIGANAGDGAKAVEGIRLVKKYGMKCRYSAMKAYILSSEELERGKVAAAGLDVVSSEPIAGDNILLRAKNCIITPHISWAPRESRQRIMDCSRDNLEAFLRGTPIHVVNP